MTKLLLISATVAAVFAQSSALTIATFDDPALDETTPLFFTNASSVSGTWTGNGLTLDLPVVSQSFNDVKFSMASVTRTGNVLGAGVVNFWTTDMNNPIFTVTFDSGSIFEPFGLGGSFVSANNVTFGGSALASAGPFSDEQFAFSFANPVIGANGNTYTAAFTSSAVPEPATLLALAGGAALLARRRRKNS